MNEKERSCSQETPERQFRFLLSLFLKSRSKILRKQRERMRQPSLSGSENLQLHRNLVILDMDHSNAAPRAQHRQR